MAYPGWVLVGPGSVPGGSRMGPGVSRVNPERLPSGPRVNPGWVPDVSQCVPVCSAWVPGPGEFAEFNCKAELLPAFFLCGAAELWPAWPLTAKALPSAREPTVAVRVSAPVQALGTGQWQSCSRLAPSPPCHDVGNSPPRNEWGIRRPVTHDSHPT